MKDTIEIFYTILSETATQADHIRFQELMKQEENLSLFNQLKKIWDESMAIRQYKAYDAKRAFYQITQKIENNKRSKKRYFLVAATGIAAGIIIMIGLFGLLSFPNTNPTHTMVSFKTETGNRSVVILPDSSKVWLNAQTTLSYNADFVNSNRNIFLSGEGYFEVKHSNKPFIVHTHDLQVKVYGTKFNVSAYPDDAQITTCLESGQISIKQPNAAKLYVEPGQLVTYEKLTSSFNLTKVNPEEYTGWRMNKMYLHNEPLRNLARKLERQYNVTILFSPYSLGEEIHYSGIFTHENIEEILDNISIASGLRYAKEKNQYIIQYKEKALIKE